MWETTEQLEATGSPVIMDGEQAQPSFATYPLAGLENLAPDGVTIPFADGHSRRLPRLARGPFRYATYAGSYVPRARRYAAKPVKQAVISAVSTPHDEVMMRPSAVSVILSAWILVAAPAAGQAPKNLAERLGYARDAKLLIVHADDIGLARSVNLASARAFESGGITSGSVLVPGPWFPDFAAWYREHESLDVGIHLTLTAEWEHYKWGGVAAAGEIPSLLDEYGHLHPTVEAVGSRVSPAEAERELRAQIERGLALGIRPTHLDTHMGSLLMIPGLVEVYLKLGKEYDLPLLIPRSWLPMAPAEFRDAIAAEQVLLDGLLMMNAADPARSWSEVYAEMIASMGPGLHQLIVHLGVDDTELQGITVNHPDFGSAWRQRDLDVVTSQAFKDLLAAHDIKLVSWDQIRRAR